MGIKVLKCGATIAAQPMLVQNVPSLSGVDGVFKDSADPHALVAKQLSFMRLRTVIELECFT